MIGDSRFEPTGWNDARPSGGRVRVVFSVLLVFGVGAGLGFVWKQGWLPIEFLPPPTGVLDPLASEDPDSPLDPQFGEQPLAEGISDHPEGGMVDSPFGALPVPESGTSGAGFFERGPIQAPPVDSQRYRRTEPGDISELPKEASRSTSIPNSLGTPDQSDTHVASGTSGASMVVPAAYVRGADEETPPLGGVENNFSSEERLSELLSNYDRELAEGNVLAAHRLLSQAYWKSPEFRPDIQERLDRTASTIFFLPQPHFVQPHLIEPGDRLEEIASRYQVPWEYLSKVNRVDPRRIQAGRRLKVVRGPFSAVVELEKYELTIHLQGYYVRRFPVGIGRDGSSPIGKFSVLNKVLNPQYTDPNGRVISGDDPANPLGERWIDLGGSYGIHGTIEPDSIGTAASRGCIRLNDADIEAVYDFLSIGSDVVIRR